MRPDMNKMTLREKIGQTGMPGPGEVRESVRRLGGYDRYFLEYPFTGLYLDTGARDAEGQPFASPQAMADTLRAANAKLRVPLLVSCDAEFGACEIFDSLHRVCTNMSVGAAADEKLAYERSYYWARELRSCGVNWAFGPVIDLVGHFLSVSGVRCMSDRPDVPARLIPAILRGIRDAGLASTAKHFPGGGSDYRDSHFSSNVNNVTSERWHARGGVLWKAAVDAGVDSIMTAHAAVPALDDSFVKPNVRRPGSASEKVLRVIREELGFDGLVVTDAVSMKGISGAFDREELYVECLNAGNDVVLFCHNDYIDAVERAVLDGRVSPKRVDEACRRVLALKEKLGLFDGPAENAPLTAEENEAFDRVGREIARKALTLVANKTGVLPFRPEAVRRAAIVPISPSARFRKDLLSLTGALAERGVETEIIDHLQSKEHLISLTERFDLLLYACYLVQGDPMGMSFFSRREDMSTLWHCLTYGAEKSAVVSFGAPSVWYHYFENADTFLNAYSADSGTMRAVVEGLFGEFDFTGQSPTALKPDF